MKVHTIQQPDEFLNGWGAYLCDRLIEESVSLDFGTLTPTLVLSGLHIASMDKRQYIVPMLAHRIEQQDTN
jgi:hypothetical protein